MMASSVSALRSRTRGIVQLTAGQTHGPITRLMSPGDLGDLVKPFVFLDYFEADGRGGPRVADHPHSGIATHTTLLEGSVDYRDSTASPDACLRVVSSGCRPVAGSSAPCSWGSDALNVMPSHLCAG